MLTELPVSIKHVFTQSAPPDTLLSALMPAVGEFLQGDRCFLYLRDPRTRLGRVPFCWVRHSGIPSVYDAHWKLEPVTLPQSDPMFAAALRAEPSIAVDDVEAASPHVLNRQFERENFGHRALIHAHLCQDGQLWGVLQPCVFEQPRHWTEAEQQAIAQVVSVMTPIAIAYVQATVVSARLQSPD